MRQDSCGNNLRKPRPRIGPVHDSTVRSSPPVDEKAGGSRRCTNWRVWLIHQCRQDPPCRLAIPLPTSNRPTIGRQRHSQASRPTRGTLVSSWAWCTTSKRSTAITSGVCEEGIMRMRIEDYHWSKQRLLSGDVSKSLWRTSRYPSDLVEDQWWISERPKTTLIELAVYFYNLQSGPQR